MSLIMISCANETKNKTESIDYELEEPIEYDDNYSMDSKPITYEYLVQQKLIDYFDLIRLKQEHPEFEKDIILQLQRFSKDSTIYNKYLKIDSIKNVRQVGAVLRESDSVQRIKLYFDIVSDNKIKSDSISAIILTRAALVDDIIFPTTLILFKELK